MTFLYPLGLLGLLGIPVLIIIYIIKSKYTEQTVSSTYLWRLSERFLKKKNPFSRLTGLISLILQILAVLAISLTIAHPIVTVPGAAQDYCFILDGTGSMQMQHEDGMTRFEAGKKYIGEMIDEAADGSTFTLICVAQDTSVVFEQTDNKKAAAALLEGLQYSFAESTLVDAQALAQAYFAENSGTHVYLVTDKGYQTHENITLIRLCDESAQNYGLSGVTYTVQDGQVTVNGSVTSYRSDATLMLELYADDGEQSVASTNVVVKREKATPFQLTATVAEFSSLRVCIANEDVLSYDNSVVLFDPQSDDTYKILLVSDRPFFIQAALGAVGKTNITVKSTEEYDNDLGYGLYIFDTFTPAAMPLDGSIWLINPLASSDDLGFSVQGEVTLPEAGVLQLSNDSTSMVQTLTADMRGEEVHMTGYVKCGMYRKFATLMSYQGDPVIFAGTNLYGNRLAVFAFDLHNSNITMRMDFIMLIRNLAEYSFPAVLEQNSFDCTDTVQINVLANTDSIRVDSPTGQVQYLSCESAVASFVPVEAGVYTLTMTVSGSPRTFYLHAAIPEAERNPVIAEKELSLVGTMGEGGFDGTYDALILMFILLALLFAADWVVYCYEKYQLR
ncbi:MAG: BatA and WFA domain-containing protein [Clostridia bacterium]|nr:BatA and WFA domain-containing protein [Clostridia bacterium]